MSYAHLTNGAVDAVGLPDVWVCADGSHVSNFPAAPAELLAAEGWVPVVDGPQPAFDPAVQVLAPVDTVAADGASVTRSWTVTLREARAEQPYADANGNPTPTVRLYTAKSGHATFRLTGDAADNLYVVCPKAPHANDKCATVAVVPPADPTDAAQVQQAKQDAANKCFAQVAGMRANGCPVHDAPPAAATTVDTVSSTVTPDEMATLVHNAAVAYSAGTVTP